MCIRDRGEVLAGGAGGGGDGENLTLRIGDGIAQLERTAAPVAHGHLAAGKQRLVPYGQEVPAVRAVPEGTQHPFLPSLKHDQSRAFPALQHDVGAAAGQMCIRDSYTEIMEFLRGLNAQGVTVAMIIVARASSSVVRLMTNSPVRRMMS